MQRLGSCDIKYKVIMIWNLNFKAGDSLSREVRTPYLDETVDKVTDLSINYFVPCIYLLSELVHAILCALCAMCMIRIPILVTTITVQHNGCMELELKFAPKNWARLGPNTMNFRRNMVEMNLTGNGLLTLFQADSVSLWLYCSDEMLSVGVYMYGIPTLIIIIVIINLRRKA